MAEPERARLPRRALPTSRRALAFLGLLAFFLTLPIVGSALGWFPRERAYLSAPSTGLKSVFSDVHRIIFEEQGDIDIAFVGSSLLHTAIDAPYLTAQLSQRLGRPVTVRVLGYTFSGDDLRYAMVKDLLAHRRVRMLVIVPTLPWGFPVEKPHVWSAHWIDALVHRELWTGLPLRLQAAYYGEAVLGAPRRLLSRLRPDLPPKVSPGDLGSVLVRLGLDGTPFVPFAPTPPTFSAAELIHQWSGPASGISSLEYPIRPLQARLFTVTAGLAAHAGTRLVALNLPYTRRDTALIEAADWSALLGRDTPLVGIAPDRLFAGISDADLAKLYWDRATDIAPRTRTSTPDVTGHFNVNGSRLFTAAMLPAFAQLLAETLARGAAR